LSFGRRLKGSDFGARLVFRDGTHHFCDLDDLNEIAGALYPLIDAIFRQSRQ
jgi:hypothetical protein